MRKNQGITLVALIITIIIMLILVAVSVNILIKSNLIGAAEKAASGYKTAQNQEQKGVIEINGEKYASIEDYQAGNVQLPEIETGEKATENSKYQTAVIPKGFTVSNITGEKDVATGLVIYDIPDNTTVDWTNPDSVKTKYNQFVWIPVEVNKTTEPKDTEDNIKNFSRTAWAADATTGGDRTSGLSEDFTEPYSYDESSYDDKTGIKAQITELTSSIYKYGGFWIGRYEAGVKPVIDEQGNVTETARTEESSQTDPFVVQQDKYPYNYIKWGTSMGDISTEGAAFLCNNLYNTADYGVKSMLCTGAAWDSILDFVKDAAHNVTTSSSWGNHYNAETYKVTRGSLSSNEGWIIADSQNGTDVTNALLTTGAAETRNVAKNLYDIAGNCYEWTTEAYIHRMRVTRGRTDFQAGAVNILQQAIEDIMAMAYIIIVVDKKLISADLDIHSALCFT